MGIDFHPAEHVFCLRGPRFTYVLQVLPQGEATHLYWGARLSGETSASVLAGLLNHGYRAFAATPVGTSLPGGSLDTLPREMPSSGGPDRRIPAISVYRPSDGLRLLELCCAGHEILSGKPPLAGLPATCVEAETEAQTLRLDLVNASRSVAAAVFVRLLARPSAPIRRLLLRGLDPAALYRVTRYGDDLVPEDRGGQGGDFLLSAGLPLPDAGAGDFGCVIWRLDAGVS